MSGGSDSGPDFWLGDRTSGNVTDFDGYLRACRSLGSLREVRVGAERDERRYLWLSVDPPLPLEGGGVADKVAVRERHAGSDVELLESDPPRDHFAWLTVAIFRIEDPSLAAGGFVSRETLVFERWGDMSRRPELLPPSNEDQFGLGVRLLLQFVNREGHANVPLDHLEDGIHLGTWVDNMKFEQANNGLREDWRERLESVPGWKWLPGNDFKLLEDYARREGHTRMPIDHVEQGRPLGGWLIELRKIHSVGRLSDDWVKRLEAIPGWEW